MEDSSNVEETKRIKCKVKKELIDDDIKEYAETTMNEMLGWYGYDETNNEKRNDTSGSVGGPESPKCNNNNESTTDGCGWCGKQVDESALDGGGGGGGLTSTVFCSELCFSQSRRANFKRNKTCDWCRHVRHTVSYVDFQDGASQLQFCSDKCLNQYKMRIFCKETRAHLDMLRPQHVTGDVNEKNGTSESAALITPELWMRDCKSPDDTKQVFPSILLPPPPPPSAARTPPSSPLPLIALRHPSKLTMPSDDDTDDVVVRKRFHQRRHKNRAVKVKVNETPQDLRIRQSPISLSYDAVAAQGSVRPVDDPVRCITVDPSDRKRSTVDDRCNNVLLPPVTVLVPYPILLPVPLPVPIPLPIASFLEAERRRAGDGRRDSTKRPLVKTEMTNDSSHVTPVHVEEDAENDDDDDEEVVERAHRPKRRRQREIVVDDVLTSTRKRKRIGDTAKGNRTEKGTVYLAATSTTL